MSALDGSVVNTILPVLARDLGTDIAGIEWVTTVYLLVVSALLLSVGRWGDLRGHKPLMLTGFLVFGLGSALCGFSTRVELLILLRGMQAVGAACLYAATPAILIAAYPAERRGQALGALGAFTYLGLTAGPSLGGWLTHALGWRAVFFVNLPVAGVAWILARRFIPDSRPTREPGEGFDPVGAGLFAAGLVALLVALNQGHVWGWRSLITLLLLGGAVLLLSLAVRHEQRQVSPTLDLALFSSRLFSASVASSICNYICVYGILFLLPFLLIEARGVDLREVGLILTAQPITMALVAPFSGRLSDRIGVRVPATFGMVVMVIALAWLARVVSGGSLASVAGGLGLFGLGTGVFTSPNSSAIMGAAPANRQGIASGVLATARNAGMVMGVGLAGAVFTTVLTHAGAGVEHGEALIRGVYLALWVLAGVSGLGAVTSWLR